MKRIPILMLILINFLVSAELKIAAASNNRAYFNELCKEFNKKYPDIKLLVTFAASKVLALQIENGADYNVFMSANMKFANELYKDHFATTKPVVYAKGLLAIFSIRDIDFKKGIDVLKDVSTISIANPSTAPFGEASIKALKNAKIYEDVKSKIVFAKNISNALSQALSASDTAIIAKNFLFMNDMKKYKKDKNYIFLDKNLYPPIEQSVVLIGNKNKDDGVKFVNFLKSSEAKEIFKKFGYEI